MSSLTTYRGLLVVTPDPTGDGGLAIQNDLKLLADRSLTQTNSKSANYTLLSTDVGQVFVGTASLTFSFTAAATLGAGWWCYIRSNVNIDTPITLAPSGTDDIDGLTTLTSYFGE